MMITVLVKFKISNELNLKTLKEKFIETSTLYVDNEGNSEMQTFFRDQLKSGRFKRNLSTKCLNY